jgi:hypothetical protein
MSTKRNLPSLEELVNDKELALKNDQLTTLLNQQPPAKWVKKHPYIKDFQYLPIDKVEYLLKKIFQSYKIEVIEQKMLMNAVSVHVRVHYKNPLSGEWAFHDGVGAKEIQTQKDTGSLKMDMSNINRGALEMALPIAKTVAIKDACDHFGKLFGSDLNRKDTLEYSVNEKFKPNLTPEHELFENIKTNISKGILSIDDLSNSYNISTEAMEVLQNA